MRLRSSTPKGEGIYQASKWIRLYILCDELELKALFDEMKDFLIYPIGKVFTQDIEAIDPGQVLQRYKQVLTNLKNKVLDLSLPDLPFVMTSQSEALYQYMPKEKCFLLQIVRPVIQWQIHRFRYSFIDGKIRSMIFGKDSIFWGFECSFPSLFQDPQTGQIVKVDRIFENFSLFSLLKKWIRNISRPTPFIIKGEKIISPIRLGNNCFSWIKEHPELSLNNIAVIHD